MRYFVNLDATPGSPPIVVDVVENPSGELDVVVDGKRTPVDVVSIGSALSVRVAGRMVDLTIEGQPPELGAIASGHRSYVRVESERQRVAAAATKGGPGGAQIIKAPMPGRIVKILVAVGAELVVGQTLCVIEAMKMENEVKAKTACVVVEVHATEGATVEGSAKLFTLA